MNNILSGLELLEQFFRTGGIGRRRGLFDIDQLHNAMIDQHRVTLRARAQTKSRAIQREPDRLGKIGIAIREKLDLPLRIIMLGPGVHHEHVIDARNSNRVDALGKDLRGMLQIARQMVVLAGRRKRARYGKQDNLAVLEEFVGRLRGRTVLGHDPEGYFWQALADGNRHTLHPWVS